MTLVAPAVVGVPAIPGITDGVPDGTAGDTTDYCARSRVTALVADDSPGKRPGSGTHESAGRRIRTSRTTG